MTEYDTKFSNIKNSISHINSLIKIFEERQTNEHVYALKHKTIYSNKSNELYNYHLDSYLMMKKIQNDLLETIQTTYMYLEKEVLSIEEEFEAEIDLTETALMLNLNILIESNSINQKKYNEKIEKINNLYIEGMNQIEEYTLECISIKDRIDQLSIGKFQKKVKTKEEN